MATILFDLDGTLTDPYEGIANCMRHTLRQYGIDLNEVDTLRSFIGPPLKDSLLKAGVQPERCEEAVILFDRQYTSSGMLENAVYEGIPQLLHRLWGKGHTLAITSSKPEQYVRQIAEHFHIDHHFAYIGGSQIDGGRSKKAEVVTYVLDALGVQDKSGVYLVGDRMHDVIGAKQTGITSIAVLYGYGSGTELKNACADVIVPTVKALEAYLLKC